jgi:hypothetical protein
MGTTNLRIGGNSANMQPGALNGRIKNPVFAYVQVDASATTLATAEVIQLFDVPAGSLVTLVPDVEVAEGATATGDIGWTEDPNGFDDALDLNVLTPQSGALAVPVTKLFQVASIVTLTLDHELDTAVLGFYISIQTI